MAARSLFWIIARMSGSCCSGVETGAGAGCVARQDASTIVMIQIAIKFYA